MGRVLLITRLVAGDIRRRPVQSALLIVMVLTTTTALTLGLALRGESETPFALTRVKTDGPDVVAENGPAPGANRPTAKQFAPLLHAPGVAATGGPYPVAFVRLTTSRIDVPVQAEGRDVVPAAIDRPQVVAGHWVVPRGAVIERGLADAMGLDVGDSIRLGGQPFRVVGIAVATQQPFYPACTPGFVWLTRRNAQQLAAPSRPLGYILDIKLDKLAAAPDFLNTRAVSEFSFVNRNQPPFFVEAWQNVRHDDYRIIGLDQKVLLIGAWLLSMLAIASVAVVVGGRMTEQTRRVGLLKAVGGTPSLVAAVLLAENLLLAVAAAVAGLLAGELLAPLLTTPGQGLLGNEGTPQLTFASAALVIGVAIAVAVLATLAPAIRGARTSTIRALNDPAHPPRRRPWVISMSARLPVPLLFAARLVARRTRRSILTCAGLTVAVAMVVAALTVEHGLAVKAQQAPPAGFFVSSNIVSGVNHVLIVLSVSLVVLAAVSAIFTAWATVIDAQGATALARALGATPRQISAGLTTAQLLPALVAACLGIPAGLLLYGLAGGHVSEAQPPVTMLLTVIPGTLIAVALMTAIPARIGARRPVAEVLRAD